MQNKLIGSLSTSLLNYVWNSKSSKKNIGTLLDPINTAICISLLNFYPSGTKISIQNNEISFQEPGTIQSISRWKNGDKYDDLANLINPIKKLIENKSEDVLWGEDRHNFMYLCKMMQSGLEKLAETYTGNHIAVHTVEYYRSLISDSLQNKDHFMHKLNPVVEYDEIRGSYDIYQDFFDDWTKDHIDVLVILLKNIYSEKYPEIKASYIDSIHKIIYGHNNRIKDIIKKVQSGFT